ncbi:hypothetical protein [Alteriqipengyuania sp.]|uniref:hypothetical protein n=1 Tax=Alteriqipengyuania sp. TaxID=2800692 RepID=UPI003514493B
MRVDIFKPLIILGAFTMVGCGEKAVDTAEEEYPAVDDLGVDDGSSQDLPELEAAKTAKTKASPKRPKVTDEPTDSGGSQDDYDAAGEYITDEPTDDGGSQDDYGAAGEP